MPRALFEKTGTAIYISHLDLMRLFQRAFKRAGLHLTHTQGFNPRPSVSIALPLSLGVESRCELLDFDLDGEMVSNEEICQRLNQALVAGVRVLEVYNEASKLKHLAFLDCEVTMEYDSEIQDTAVRRIRELFERDEILVEKKSKNGVTEQNILPMVQSLTVEAQDSEIILKARVCCQNPTLNPMQLSAAIEKYLPDLTADFVHVSRVEIYNTNNEVFR